MVDSPGEVSRLLAELKAGNKDALGSLMPLVTGSCDAWPETVFVASATDIRYNQRRWYTKHICGSWGKEQADWQNHGQFVAVAAQLMRRILVDYARARATQKAGR